MPSDEQPPVSDQSEDGASAEDKPAGEEQRRAKRRAQLDELSRLSQELEGGYR